MGDFFGYYPISNIILSDLFLTQCGWEICESRHKYGPAVRDHFLIHYIARGKGTFLKDGKVHHLKEGDGFVIFPSETTTYVADCEQPWEYYWVGFSGTAASKLLAGASLSAKSPIFHLSLPLEQVTGCIKDIYTNASFSNGGEIRALGLLLVFLSMVTDSSCQSNKEKHFSSIQSDYVAKAISFIQENHSHNISIQELSDFVGIDRSYLYRIFKNILGVSPQDFLIEFRIQRACQLLLETNMDISSIANYVGFSTPTHMSVAFNRINNISPSKYRKQFKKILDV